MGYSIQVSRREAARAVSRGVAKIIEAAPAEHYLKMDEIGNHEYVDKNAELRIVVECEDGPLVMSDWRSEAGDHFWTHCHYGSVRGDWIQSVLSKVGIRYTIS